MTSSSIPVVIVPLRAVHPRTVGDRDQNALRYNTSQVGSVADRQPEPWRLDPAPTAERYPVSLPPLGGG
jgi:hypothetical protein